MRTAVRVGPVAAERGQVAKGLLPVGDLADGCTPIHVPVIVVNGVDDGPIAYLHAGSHGQETVYAVELMRRLVHDGLDVRRLRGAVILVPAANLLAHHAASRIAPHYGVREGGAFGGDLHKLWPGEASGSITQRIASTIWTEIVAQADVVVDYHTNSSPGLPFALLYQHSARGSSAADDVWRRSVTDVPRLGRTDDVDDHTNSSPGLPFTLLYQHSAPASRGADEVWRRTVELARAFGLTVVRGAPTPNALSGASILPGSRP